MNPTVRSAEPTRTVSEHPPTAPVTVAHDYFTQLGGAERVAVALVAGLDPASVVTAVHAPGRTFPLPTGTRVRTTLLQHVPAFRRDPRRALPLLALAWSSLRPVASGVVVCSSSGWAHGIPVAADVVKVVYCHNPARWLYQPEDYFRGRSAAFRALFRVIRGPLMLWDRAAARSADAYIANSTSVAQRIREAYGIEPHLVFPPVSIDARAPQAPVDEVGTAPYFLSVGRGRGYKNLDLVVEAFRRTPERRLVAVGADVADPPENVTVLPRVGDAEIRWLYAHATALVSMSHEDFGLTPLEANALGTPSLVLRAGGFLDSVVEGVTGLFVDEETPEAVARAVADFPDHWEPDAIRAHAAGYSPAAFIGRVQEVVGEAVRARASTRPASRGRAARRQPA